MRGFLGSTAALVGMLGRSSAAWSQAQQPNWPDYGPDLWNDGEWMVLGPPMLIVFIAAIVVVVVVVVRRRGTTGDGAAPHPPPGRTPLDILEERFARGEIDQAEFEERRRTLGE